MKRVITAVILIPIVVVALFKTPLWLFTLLVFGVAVLAAHEYLGIAKAQGFQPFSALSYIFLALSFLTLFVLDVAVTIGVHTTSVDAALAVLFWTLPLFGLLAPLLLLIAALDRDPLSRGLPDAAVSYMLLPYVGFSLNVLVLLRNLQNGALYLLFLMLLVWGGDIAAYYVGRAFGKHKLAPRISPGKTWEGSAGSVLGAIVIGLLLFHFINPIANAFRATHLLGSAYTHYHTAEMPSRTFEIVPLWLVVSFAICVNVAAQVGDLVESGMKRGAGVKDSGALLPGHGGVLDRIDAILFALPVGLIFCVAGMARYFSPAVLSR